MSDIGDGTVQVKNIYWAVLTELASLKMISKYIYARKTDSMTQEITLSLEAAHVQFIKEHAERTGTTISKIVDNYLELLQKADAAYKKENIHPRVATVSGIVSINK